MRYADMPIEKRVGTYVEYRKMCKKDESLKKYKSFKEYDEEQTVKNLDYDVNTYKCLE